MDIVQRCYTGIETRNDVLWFDPDLPDALKKLNLHIHYRGHSMAVELTHNCLRVMSKHSIAKKIQIGFKGEVFDLSAGEMKEFPLKNASYVFGKSLISLPFDEIVSSEVPENQKPDSYGKKIHRSLKDEYASRR